MHANFPCMIWIYKNLLSFVGFIIKFLICPFLSGLVDQCVEQRNFSFERLGLKGYHGQTFCFPSSRLIYLHDPREIEGKIPSQRPHTGTSFPLFRATHYFFLIYKHTWPLQFPLSITGRSFDPQWERLLRTRVVGLKKLKIIQQCATKFTFLNREKRHIQST